MVENFQFFITKNYHFKIDYCGYLWYAKSITLIGEIVHRGVTSMPMQATTSRTTHQKMRLLSTPIQHCLLQAAKYPLDPGSPLRYAFFEIYQGRIKTRITQIDECKIHVCHLHADVLDFDDNIIGKIEADVNTALNNGLYWYV